MAKSANRGTGGSGGKKPKAEKKAEIPQQRQSGSGTGNKPHARYNEVMPRTGSKHKNKHK